MVKGKGFMIYGLRDLSFRVTGLEVSIRVCNSGFRVFGFRV